MLTPLNWNYRDEMQDEVDYNLIYFSWMAIQYFIGFLKTMVF